MSHEEVLNGSVQSNHADKLENFPPNLTGFEQKTFYFVLLHSDAQLVQLAAGTAIWHKNLTLKKNLSFAWVLIFDVHKKAWPNFVCREPPPPPSGSSRHYRVGGPSSHSPASGQREGPQLVRPPHYSPPPTHKTHLSRHPSRSSLVAPSNAGSASSTLSRNQHHRSRVRRVKIYLSIAVLTTIFIAGNWQKRQNRNIKIYNWFEFSQGHQAHPPTDMTELLNLVTAQQSTLQAQQADIRQVRRALIL